MSPSRAFTLPWSNPDLDIHPDPSEGWHRVAVVGLWQDAKVIRKSWPDAAVVGPLRTLRGIDLLVRGLLANPQVRVLVVTGRDLSPGEGVRRALETAWVLWAGDTHGPAAPDINSCAFYVTQGVILSGCAPGYIKADLKADRSIMGLREDRPGGAIILPPPPPPTSPELPAGLPGQRVTGRTLADVWPKVLQEVLRFGDAVATSYGGSRELLNLVSVIEDPRGSLAEFGRGGQYEPTPEGMAFRAPPHPILGISWVDLDDYYVKSFMGPTPPEMVPYSYGSRLYGSLTVDRTPTPYHTNQLAAVRKLLRDAPGTRAAWLTPWRPDEDCGMESGRPCLVGAWFRAVEDGASGLSRGDSLLRRNEASFPTGVPAQPYTLHLTVTFRSHDMHGAYPLNLAAVCRWLCEEAKALNMEVGTVTCVSMSAHVYDHALEAAGKVVAEHVKLGAWSQDARSAWRVWSSPCPHSVGFTWKCDEDLFEILEVHATGTSYLIRGPRGQIGVSADNLAERLGVPAKYTYHAEATDPGGTRVLRVFEAPTKERLLLDIQASGLVTSVEHALWLGGEVGRL